MMLPVFLGREVAGAHDIICMNGMNASEVYFAGIGSSDM